jgi:Rod binding domain-containing protein
MDSGIKISLPTSLPPGEKTGLSGNKQVQKTAEEFESFLIFSVLKECEKSMNFTKKSSAEQTQMSLFYEKVADVLAKKGIGVKETLSKFLERGAKVSEKLVENK